MAVKLHADSLALLNSSSDFGVALTMQRVAGTLSDGHWLAPSHRYRDRGRRLGNNRLISDLSNGTVHSAALAEYVATSAPVHCMDGWSLLGKSIHCLSRGDPYSAVHLAYYAELRAALALLAAEGIGVFVRTHCVIDSEGNCSLVEALDESKESIGNHMWTWLVFQWWARESRAVEFLRKVIAPGGQALGIWIESMTRSRFAIEELGSKWLRLWGLDIGRFFGDRDARNAASYWPNTTNSWAERNVEQNCQAIADIWMSLEPSSESRFAELDRHLLRIVLHDGFQGATGRGATSVVGSTEYAQDVDVLLRNMAMPDTMKSSWRTFLTDFELKEPAVVKMAHGSAKVGDANHVVEVMSRATMLLRLATGASANLMSDAGIEREHLEFWIQSVGTSRGVWRPEQPPESLVDLWADVESALDDIDDWLGGTAPSMREIWSDRPGELARLGECERVALWGLGL